MPNLTVSPDATGLPAFLTAPVVARSARGRVPGSKRPDIPKAATAEDHDKVPREAVRRVTADADAPRIVLFRADNPAPGVTRITAVFPCEPAFGGEMLGFTREEGAMTCSQLWFDLSRPASAERYEELAALLRRQGHRLDIRHRLTPAMHTTRAWRANEDHISAGRPQTAETPAFRELGKTSHPALRTAIGDERHGNNLPVVYRADPANPTRAVAVLVYGLPDEPGLMGFTESGLVVVSEPWFAASVPAGRKHIKPVALALKAATGARIVVHEALTEDTRAVAESRRKSRFSRIPPDCIKTYLDIGRASALAADKPDPKAAAMLLAHTAFGVAIGHLATAFQMGWQEVHDTVEAAKLLAA